MVSVIILNYNTAKLTIQCISTFKEFHADIDFEIIVVDNNSTEETTSEIQSKHPDINWIQSGYNAGYARGNNLGIKSSTSEYILIVNSDVIFTEEIISSCLQKARSGGLFIAGCKLLNTDSTQQESLYYYFGGFKSILANNFLCVKMFRSWFENKTGGIKGIKGALLLFPRSVINATGYFDENFFLFGEEVEWQHRAVKLGTTLIYEPEVSVIHIESGSSNNDKLETQRGVSHWLLVKKIHGNLYLIATLFLDIINVLSQYPFYWAYNQEGRHNLNRHALSLLRPFKWVIKILLLKKESDMLVKAI